MIPYGTFFFQNPPVVNYLWNMVSYVCNEMVVLIGALQACSQ